MSSGGLTSLCGGLGRFLVGSSPVNAPSLSRLITSSASVIMICCVRAALIPAYGTDNKSNRFNWPAINWRHILCALMATYLNHLILSRLAASVRHSGEQ